MQEKHKNCEKGKFLFARDAIFASSRLNKDTNNRCSAVYTVHTHTHIYIYIYIYIYISTSL